MEGKKFEIEAEKNGTGENTAEAEKAVKRGRGAGRWIL